MSENKTLEELVNEHGFRVWLTNMNTYQMVAVLCQSKTTAGAYICEIEDGQVFLASKASTAFEFQGKKVKRAQYLLIPKSDAHVPAKCDEYFKDEKDFFSMYDKDRVEKAIRLTETEREFDW